MKNLVCITEHHVESPEPGPLLATAGGSSVWFVTPDHCLLQVDSSSGDVVAELALDGDEGFGPNPTFVAAAAVPFLGLALASAAGDIGVVDENSGALEMVGLIDAGLVSMHWSPDGEVVVFVTAVNSIFAFTHEFEPLGEVALGPPDGTSPKVSWEPVGDNFVVSVDSGSEESGGAGKVLKVFSRAVECLTTSEAFPGLGDLVAWRPKNNLIATTQTLPNKFEVLLVERNLLRRSSFELSPNPDANVYALEFSANADLLAVALELDGCVALQLWTRRNYHWYLKSECELGDSPPLFLAFDTTAALTLHTVDCRGGYSRRDFVFDTCTSGSDDTAVDKAFAAVIDGSRLLVTPFRTAVVPPPMSDTVLTTGPLAAAVASAAAPPAAGSETSTSVSGGAPPAGESPTGESAGSSPGATATTASATDRAPPLAAAAFGPSADLVVTTTSGLLGLYRPSGKRGDRAFNLGAVVDLSTVFGSRQAAASVRQIALADAYTVLCLSHVGGGDSGPTAATDVLTAVRIEPGSGGGDSPTDLVSSATVVATLALPCGDTTGSSDGGAPASGPVLRLNYAAATSTTYVSLADGSLAVWDWANGSLEPALIRLSKSAPYISSCRTADAGIVPVALTGVGGALTLGGLPVATRVTSFALHSAFLCYTTLSQSLVMLPLNEPFNPNDGVGAVQQTSNGGTQQEGDSSGSNELTRFIERGATIVTVDRCGIRVVLQLPRGNLEAVYPRALALTTIHRLLAERNYLEAFCTARTQRVDLNVLFDRHPQALLDDMEEFVTQIEDPSFINLFLSSLRSEDVTEALFSRSRRADALAADVGGFDFTTKVNCICDAVLAVPLLESNPRYTLCVLTAYVCKKPPALEAVVLKIRDLHDAECGATISLDAPADGAGSSGAGKAAGVTCEAAVKYVTMFVDIGDLFNTALGMYDFDLVKLMAAWSQKDPKEYLSLLANFDALEPPYRYFAIDKHLERYSSALQHILSDPSHDSEAIEFVATHKLYHEALGSLADDPERIKPFYSAFADYLLSKSRGADAAAAYLKAGDTESALAAYKSAHEWEYVMALAFSSGYEPEAVTSLALEMAEALEETKDFAAAATLLTTYCNDDEQAVLVLTRGHRWAAATRLAHSAGRADLLETTVRPELFSAAATTLDVLREKSESYMASVNRLLEIRAKRAAFAALSIGAGHPGQDDDIDSNDDLFSEAGSIMSSTSTTSVSSTNSSMSMRSQRRRKARQAKKKRKKNRGKGGAYEERYLCDKIKSMLPSRDDQTEIKELITALTFAGSLERAANVQTAYEGYLTTVESNYPDVTPSVPDEEDDEEAGPAAPPPLPYESIRWKSKLVKEGDTEL